MIFDIGFTALSDVGLVRSNNEDRWLALNTHNGDIVLAVADGMGGHQAGEIASSETVEFLQKAFSKQNLNETTWGDQDQDPPDFFDNEFILQMIQKNNSKIYHLSLEKNESKGMGTTLTMAIIRKNLLKIAQIGDSRAYLIRKKKLIRLTKDHSVVQREVDMGLLSPEEALHDPRKNIITKALGILPEVEPDLYEYRLSPKDRILICSDGLYDLVPENELLSICTDSSIEKVSYKLIEQAKQYGGKDNITVVLADINEKHKKEKRSFFSFKKNPKDKKK